MPLSYIPYSSRMKDSGMGDEDGAEVNVTSTAIPVRSRRRLWILRLSTSLIGMMGLFLFLEITLRFFPVRESFHAQPVTSLHPIIRFTPNQEYVFSRDWNFTIVTDKKTNGAGFFSDVEYVKDSDKPLVAIIGDSYVEALQVNNADTFHGRIGRDNFEKVRVYAFGASGNPLSSYLKYAEWVGQQYKPDYFIFNIVGNDFDESYPYYKDGAEGFTYFPEQTDQFDMAELDTHFLPLRPSFVGRNLRRSYLARYLVSNCEIRRITANLRTTAKADTSNGNIGEERIQTGSAAINHFIRLLPEATGLVPERILLVLDASRQRIYASESNVLSQSYYECMMPELIRKAALAQISTLDMTRPFTLHYGQHKKRFEYPTDGHWNEIGHRVVAESIMDTDFWSTVIGE